MSAGVRVDGFVFPHIYSKFTRPDKNNVDLVEYWIQDLPENRFEDAVEFLNKHMHYDEPMYDCKKLCEDINALEIVNGMYQEYLSHKVSLVCFKENSDEIIGFNILKIMTKDEHFKEPKVRLEIYYFTFGYTCILKFLSQSKSAVWNDIMDAIYVLEDQCNVFDHYNVSEGLFSFGLIVNPEYRGRGIATELLKARRPLMESLNLQLTASTFSAPGSQNAAKKAGFEENVSVLYVLKI